jgi:flagellar motor protein MotB
VPSQESFCDKYCNAFQEGMAAGSVMSKGFGKNQLVASNDTAQGRQQNRRGEFLFRSVGRIKVKE